MNPHVASPETNTAKKKAYIAPAFNRVTPEEAKEAKGLLLRHADVKDPDVMKMLQCIEELQRQNEPGTSR